MKFRPQMARRGLCRLGLRKVTTGGEPAPGVPSCHTALLPRCPGQQSEPCAFPLGGVPIQHPDTIGYFGGTMGLFPACHHGEVAFLIFVSLPPLGLCLNKTLNLHRQQNDIIMTPGKAIYQTVVTGTLAKCHKAQEGGAGSRFRQVRGSEGKSQPDLVVRLDHFRV